MTEFATRCVHAGLQPDPTFRSIIPPIHQALPRISRRKVTPISVWIVWPVLGTARPDAAVIVGRHPP